jgi:alanyl-tRNA synthetase
MTASEVRRKFLEFFASKAHHIAPSAPIVVKNDPTLMFTNAGMNQFKDIFLGNDPVVHPRVADTQKCLRVSGKHNDLEEVGVDTYHHTMFEMLGNWSFGDYYKRESIQWAWELLTEVYRIDPDRLYVTVFAGDQADGLPFDQEAWDVWKNLVPESRILPASKKDNFWEMGDTGPCGPCSEIHVDMRSGAERAATLGRELVNKDHPQVIEIWNLVFMEMQRRSDGSLVPLPARHIDTGMGFERLCMVLQGKPSTYDTDVFTPLIRFIEAETGHNYTGTATKKDIAFRVLADHIRAVAFAIADGQLPSSSGAGYVIRRILRRAVRYAYSFLDRKEPLLHLLAGVLVQELGTFFKELKANEKLIAQVIREEEDAFLKTLARGIQRIEELLSQNDAPVVSGEVVFELYDTFGFPADLTALILSEKGKTYDEAGFQAALQAQKVRSRKAAVQDTGDWVELLPHQGTQFLGYDTLSCDMTLTRYRKVSQKGKELFQLVFDRTPFYPEGGGQVGDTGVIHTPAGKYPIVGTLRENNLIIHLSPQSPDGITGEVRGEVNAEARKRTAKNHSATHLLHHALREVLGTHVEQKGSLVEKGYLRFDFSHFTKVSPEELRTIEQKVNAMAREDLPLEEYRRVPMNQAIEMGAIALFGEKYGDEVRVIRFGESIELCGGTHVQRTGEIGLFKLTSEGSVAAGVRRVEAITADTAENYLYHLEAQLNTIREKLKTSDVGKAIDQLLDAKAAMEKELETYKLAHMARVKKELLDTAERVGDVFFISRKVELDGDAVKDLVFQMRRELSPAMIVLGTAENTKATLSVALSDELVQNYGLNAVAVVRELSTFIQGGGGGQPFYATAGGKNPEGLDAALAKARTYLS